MPDAGGIDVLLGAESLLQHRSGVGRMTLEIARQLRAHRQVDHLHLLICGGLLPAEALEDVRVPQGGLLAMVPMAVKRRLAGLPLVGSVREKLLRRRLDRELAALAAVAGRPLVYHEPNMIVTPFDGVTVATFNDLSWLHHPETHPAERIEWIGRGLERTLRQAARFVAISEFTAKGMVAELGVRRDLIDVVPLAPSPLFGPVDGESAAGTLARYGLRDRRYVLSVSTLEPRKNFDRLFAAWSRLRTAERDEFPLVIVGAHGWGRVLADAEVERAQRGGAVKLLGHIADAELCQLYSRCAAFAYVSLYEGFGLPLVEAMAAGAPVVASRTTACGETAGEAALLVEPTDVGAIAEALRSVIEDARLADRLRALGSAHASRFRWERSVELLLESWRRAI